MAADNEPTLKAIRTQLERILTSSVFRGSDKQRKFLKFVIDETLEGRGSKLKGFTIAVGVYGRTEKFDPQVDPIVRVEAGRLRRALEHYYLTAGKNDPVRITIPKGGYVPAFRTVQTPPPETRAPDSGPQKAAPTGHASIAVMPLDNLNADPEQAYFIDGLTEELTAELARYQDLRVIAAHSTLRFKGQKVDPAEAGRDLGVRFVLAGSVRHDAKTVKVTIRLIDTPGAEQIWGQSYKRDRTAADLIGVQEEIAGSAVGAIADQYGLIQRRMSAESRKKAPADFKAYDAVLRFYHYETNLTPQAFDKALAALEQAIQLDLEYGLAWAMLGHLHADNYALGFRQMEAPLDKALFYAQKGVALAPDSQFAHDALTLVYFHLGDKDFFLKHVEKTIALNPNAPYIVGVAGWHLALYGEWERGIKLLKKGMKLNPYHPTWFHLAPYMDCYRRGDFENALAEALKFNYPELYWDPLMRAAALSRMDRIKEASKAVDQLLELEANFAARGRELIGRYVKVEDLVDSIVTGLRKAGLADLK